MNDNDFIRLDLGDGAAALVRASQVSCVLPRRDGCLVLLKSEMDFSCAMTVDEVFAEIKALASQYATIET